MTPASALLYTDLTTDTPTDDITALAVKASHVTVRTYRAGTRPIHSDLVGIIINGARFHDATAACNCSDLEVYKAGDYGYTRCKAHGTLAIGPLRRDVSAGHGRK